MLCWKTNRIWNNFDVNFNPNFIRDFFFFDGWQWSFFWLAALTVCEYGKSTSAHTHTQLFFSNSISVTLAYSSILKVFFRNWRNVLWKPTCANAMNKNKCTNCTKYDLEMFLYGLTEKKKNLRCEDEDKKNYWTAISSPSTHTHTHMAYGYQFCDSNYEQWFRTRCV